MKCPYCNNGISRYTHDGFKWPCTVCDGKGEIKMTNEEWLCSLSTEEKAEFMSNNCGHAIDLWIHTQFYSARKQCDKQRWVEWMKEEHK